MQFSQKVLQLSKLHNIEPKDVLFAMLAAAGASIAEAFAVIFRPAASTNNALATRASQHIGQRPALRKLIDELTAERSNDPDQPTARRGRPRKATNQDADTQQGRPSLDYTDKDAVLKEYAEVAVTAEKIGDKLAALNGIANLQRMKQESKVEEEKRVQFYIPLTYERAEELRQYLARYYAESPEKSAD